MSGNVNGVALAVFLFFFLAVTVMGFAAARWRRARRAASLDEWGLGGRGFGTVISWFLMGGDIYTAYTFIAVPAVVFGVGASGFFSVPALTLAYPLGFVFVARLWSISRRRGYVTPTDFVRDRYGSRALSLAVALTGILATMPYLALQLIGLQSVLTAMGIGGTGSSWFGRDLPLFIAFAVLAAYTYSSGLRAPALISFVKDALIYVVIAVAVIYIPHKLGGFAHIFASAQSALAARNPATHAPPGAMVPSPSTMVAYATSAVGTALTLYVYPHNVTTVLASKDRDVVRRNSAVLPIYSIMLGMLALLGYMAIAAGIKPIGGNAQLVVPQLFGVMFPSWFAGICYAAIGIGALVPAAVMSIAAANTFTRNVYREFIRPDATPAHEAKVSKLVSLLIKVGALAFVIGLNPAFSINLQLLGGIWILQTFPALVVGLYTRWLHRRALLAGWLVSMVYGTIAAYNVPATGKPGSHFGGSSAPIPFTHVVCYIAITALVINVIIAVAGTLVLRALKVPAGSDKTKPADFYTTEREALETEAGHGSHPAAAAQS
jgi:SSS family solute:Na+ symporter